MLIKSKYKLARRYGPQIFEKTQTQKFSVRAARKAKNLKVNRPRSDFGKALAEKQRARFTYGLNERQFSKYAKEAIAEKKKKPEESFFEKLETRLDNIVYRFKLADTRRQARQMVSHGHIAVRGRRVTVPSFRVSVGDLVSIMPSSKATKLFSNLSEKMKEHQMPAWLSFDVPRTEGKVLAAPIYQPSELAFSVPAILEFYRR
jgi:small subunit ribosomal protein S4